MLANFATPSNNHIVQLYSSASHRSLTPLKIKLSSWPAPHIATTVTPMHHFNLCTHILTHYGKNSHISRIYNSVTHLQSDTNTAIEDISPETPRQAECQCSHWAECQCSCIKWRYCHIERQVLECFMMFHNSFRRNTHFRIIKNSVRHLRSCSDYTHLQKIYPNSAELLTNSVPSNGANIFVAIELDCWTISSAPSPNNQLSTSTEQLI